MFTKTKDSTPPLSMAKAHVRLRKQSFLPASGFDSARPKKMNKQIVAVVENIFNHSVPVTVFIVVDTVCV